MEVARQQLLGDENTKRIASSLGIELAEYVEMVLDYAQHPDKEPMVEVLNAEDLAQVEAAGQAPTRAEVMQWFEDVKEGRVEVPIGPQVKTEKDGFAKGKDQAEKLRAAAGVQVERVAPKVEDTVRKAGPAPAAGVGSVLQEQLRAQQQMAQQALGKKGTKKQPK